MIFGFYYLDGVEHEYNIDGKNIFDGAGKTIARVWAYPVRQGVYGGEPRILYFSTKELRDQYMRDHDYCDALPRRKVPEL